MYALQARFRITPQPQSHFRSRSFSTSAPMPVRFLINGTITTAS